MVEYWGYKLDHVWVQSMAARMAVLMAVLTDGVKAFSMVGELGY
jgi:hypothetical protein